MGDIVEVTTDFSVTANRSSSRKQVGRNRLRLTRGQTLEVIKITDKGLVLRDRKSPQAYRVAGNDVDKLVGEFSSLWTDSPTFKARVQASVNYNKTS